MNKKFYLYIGIIIFLSIVSILVNVKFYSKNDILKVRKKVETLEKTFQSNSEKIKKIKNVDKEKKLKQIYEIAKKNNVKVISLNSNNDELTLEFIGDFKSVIKTLLDSKEVVFPFSIYSLSISANNYKVVYKLLDKFSYFKKVDFNNINYPFVNKEIVSKKKENKEVILEIGSIFNDEVKIGKKWYKVGDKVNGATIILIKQNLIKLKTKKGIKKLYLYQ